MTPSQEVWRRFWNREVNLEEGHFYFIQEADAETPIIGRFMGWTDEVPVFRFLEDATPKNVKVAILGETRDPFRDRDDFDPPVA